MADELEPPYEVPGDGGGGGSLGGGVPAGGVLFTAGSVPDGFLACDGSAISRNEYRRLFAAIGTTYGNGDGATTFNLPDLTGRFVVGSGGGYVAGETGGEEQVTLQQADMPTHAHTVGLSSDGQHSHGGAVGSTSHGHSASSGDTTHSHGSASHKHPSDGHAHDSGALGDHQHALTQWTSNNEASGYGLTKTSAFANRVLVDTGTAHRDATEWKGHHDHAVDKRYHQHGSVSHSHPSNKHAHTVSVGSNSHNHAIPSQTSHSHAATVGDAGSGGSHENRPPFIGLLGIIRY